MADEKIIHCHPSNFRTIDEIEESSFAYIDVSEPIVNADGSEPPQMLASRVGMEWNNQNLFIFFRGRFDTLRLVPPDQPSPMHGKTHKLWEQSDVFEIFIGPNARQSGLYKEFQVSPDSRWLDIDVNRQLGISNHHWYSGMRCKSIIDKEMQIWTSIVELPWNCFGSYKRTEEQWNVNFYRASGTFHGEQLMAWSPTGLGERCFHRFEHFGSIEFLQ
jgi:hypothetical protein